MKTCTVCGKPSVSTWCQTCTTWGTQTAHLTARYRGQARAHIYRMAYSLIAIAHDTDARTHDRTTCACCGRRPPTRDIVGLSLWRVCDRCYMVAISLDGDEPQQIEYNVKSVRATYVIGPKDYAKLPLLSQLCEAYRCAMPSIPVPTIDESEDVQAWFDAVALGDLPATYHRRYKVGESDAR